MLDCQLWAISTKVRRYICPNKIQNKLSPQKKPRLQRVTAHSKPDKLLNLLIIRERSPSNIAIICCKQLTGVRSKVFPCPFSNQQCIKTRKKLRVISRVTLPREHKGRRIIRLCCILCSHESMGPMPSSLSDLDDYSPPLRSAFPPKNTDVRQSLSFACTKQIIKIPTYPYCNR